MHYTLSSENAHNINKRRIQARDRVDIKGGEIPAWHGNAVQEGDVYPMLITRLWTESPKEDSPVQGQVFLDGNDSLWVTSVLQGEGVCRWADPNPPRVE